jgi:hypothetical protein
METSIKFPQTNAVRESGNGTVQQYKVTYTALNTGVHST